MEVKILGGGCPRCEKLEKTARAAAEELGIDVEFTKIKNMTKIMEYDILETPALVINEKVKSFGRLPVKEEIIEWMTVEK